MSQVRLNERTANDIAEPILQITHLTVKFKKTQGRFRKFQTVIKAVDDVSFGLRKSEIVSVVGESGSGKTTLSRCILCLVPPSSGSVRFMGKEITGLKGTELKEYRKSVQIVFQDPFESLNARLDVLSTLATPLRELVGERRKERIVDKASKLLREVGLVPEEVLLKYPHQLSGGEKQRINIARALAPDPKILVADEPITMLDAEQKLNVLSLLLNLKRQRNLTILMITHDLASASVMSDQTMVMYHGKIVEVGESDVILSRPHHPYVQQILRATPSLEVPLNEEFEKSFRSWKESDVPPKIGCAYFPRCAYATEICQKEQPPLNEKSKSHYAACHNPLNL